MERSETWRERERMLGKRGKGVLVIIASMIIELPGGKGQFEGPTFGLDIGMFARRRDPDLIFESCFFSCRWWQKTRCAVLIIRRRVVPIT